MTIPKARTLWVAALAVLLLSPILVTRMVAPANFGAHGLTTGFGRGRLDLPGIVSEGQGARVDLPRGALRLTVRLSGSGPIRLHGEGADLMVAATEIPESVRFDFPKGGALSIESAARFRLHELVIEREGPSRLETGVMVALGILGVLLASRGPRPALAAAVVLLAAFFGLTRETLSGTFAEIALAQLLPVLALALLLTPLVLAIKEARFPSWGDASRLSVLAFVSSLALTSVQLLRFNQPLPLGDPAAYFQMGGRFADALIHLRSPLDLGPLLTEVQPYLALPATGLLYGLLRFLGFGLAVIYAVQGLAMALSVAALVAICEAEIGSRAAKVALALALLHPSFSILPGIVQPEPFILAAWTMGALAALGALRTGGGLRGLLGTGVLLGAGLSLHPQGLSFLLVALALCLLPWGLWLAKQKALILAPLLGVVSVLLPVAAAEHFSKPLAYVLDKQYGFFAYTSPHPLGFWLYLDSQGWQGPLRIEDTSYQSELLALKGESGTSSSFIDVAGFVSRHPAASAQAVFTNLHRLWRQPDNPFALSFVLPYEVQVPFHRGLIVLFLLSLPALLGGRLALVALPFAMLSMTYPAYHIFNKYGTPALPFTIIGASLLIDRFWREGIRPRLLLTGLVCAALGALLPAVAFARFGVSGDSFLGLVRGLLWFGLSLALVSSIKAFGADARSKVLAAILGSAVLMVGSFAASRTDTARGTWAVALDQPLEVSCRIDATSPRPGGPLDPAWILIDAETGPAPPPRVEINGQALEPPVPTMPAFGLATLRGHRDPTAFRQIWRTRVSEEMIASGELNIRVSGSPAVRIFGDIRGGDEGPRLSLGNWPYLSVYRLMHEGQYRLPTKDTPPQACVTPSLSGRPGISLVRIPAGEETQMALKSAKPPTWIF